MEFLTFFSHLHYVESTKLSKATILLTIPSTKQQRFLLLFR